MRHNGLRSGGKEEGDEEDDTSQQGEGLEGVLCYGGKGSMGKAIQGDHDQINPESRNGWPSCRHSAIVHELFLTRSRDFICRINRSISMSDGEDICLITEEVLLNVGAEINPNKAVGVNSIPGTVVKELIEKRTDKMLRVLNAVNVSGRKAVMWKVAKVVLIPKPDRVSIIEVV